MLFALFLALCVDVCISVWKKGLHILSLPIKKEKKRRGCIPIACFRIVPIYFSNDEFACYSVFEHVTKQSARENTIHFKCSNCVITCPSLLSSFILSLFIHFTSGSLSSSILKTPVGTESKLIPKSFPFFPYTTEVQGSANEVFELIPLSDEEEETQNKTRTPEKFVSRENGTSTDQTASKPLILFEDVDAILSEDHGLIATIQKLAETAKRPIILTSNSKRSNWLK